MGRDESKFKLYWFNKSDNAWEVLPSTFNSNTKTFTASITKLGQFAIGYDVTPPQYSLLDVEQTDSYYVYKTNNPDIKIKIDDSGSGVLPSSIQVKIDNAVTNYTYNSFEGVVDVNYGSTLQEGVHTLSISSTDTSGNSSSATFNIKIETLPGKPTLSLNTVTQSSISLSWTASTPGTYPLDHYELYRAIPGKGIDFTLLATLNLNTLSYTDNDIQYPNEYIYYIVKAYDTNGNSVMSAPLVVQPVSPPSAPSNILATTSASSITLTWSPSTQGTYPIAGYAIYRGTSQGNESPTPIATVGSNTTTYTDKDVISGTTYYYYVKAFDNQNPPDYSQASNEISAKVETFTITATADSGGTITPSGNIVVNYGGSKTFTITPDKGYKISDVKVDGKSVGAVSTYTFTNVTDNHTIEATFEKNQIVIVLHVGQTTFTVNGIPHTLDSPPVIKNSRTLVPIRAIVESLGGTVGWDGTEKKVTISLGSTTIELWIGKNTAKVNGVTKPIDSTNPKVVPEIMKSRTMLPLRFVTENLGCTVQWDGSTQTITITYGG
jgi:hypothetical protein